MWNEMDMSKNYIMDKHEAIVLNNKGASLFTHYKDDELLIYLTFPDFILRLTDLEKLILFLQSVKQKYIEWEQIAITNRVNNFSKPINSFTMEVPRKIGVIGLEHYLKWHCAFNVSSQGIIYLSNIIYMSSGHCYKNHGGFHYVKKYLKEFIKSRSWIGKAPDDVICDYGYIYRDKYGVSRELYLTDNPTQLNSSYGNNKYSLSYVDELETKVKESTKIYKEKQQKEQDKYEEYKKTQDEYAKTNDLFK